MRRPEVEGDAREDEIEHPAPRWHGDSIEVLRPEQRVDGKLVIGGLPLVRRHEERIDPLSPREPPLREEGPARERMKRRDSLHPVLHRPSPIEHGVEPGDPRANDVHLQVVDLPEGPREARREPRHALPRPTFVLGAGCVLDAHREHLEVLVAQLAQRIGAGAPGLHGQCKRTPRSPSPRFKPGAPLLTSRRMSLRRWWGAAWLVLAASIAGCARHGAQGAATGGATDLDADPLALVPAGAIVVGNVDARAAFASAFGPSLGKALTALLPLPDSVGFQPAHDIDRAVVASYPANAPDVIVVLAGRFDPAQIQAATQTRSGAPITSANYAGFVTETAGQVTFAALSAKTLIAGTATRVQAVIDRVKQGRFDRAVSPQVIEALQSPGAQAALVADFSSQPVPVGNIGVINLGWLRGLKLVRAIADFNPPGLNVASTSTFADPTAATTAVAGIHALDGWLTVLAPALGGARIQNLQVDAVGSDVTCKFAVDGAALAALLDLGTRFIPGR